jgi:hypothetical protein
LHRFANPRVGAAAANVSDGSRELLIGWRRIRGQKRADGHDHARLAVAALRHLMIDPRLLYGIQRAAAQTFDGGDFGVRRGLHRNTTTAHRLAVEMHGAGSASADTAAELCACKVQLIANDPQERRVGLDVDVVRDAIYFQMDGYGYLLSVRSVVGLGLALYE